MALLQRKIGATFQLATGAFQAPLAANVFSESGTDTVTLPNNLRIRSKIVKAGGASMASLDMRIFGMTKSLMNRLSTLGVQVQLVPKNIITVTAGDDTNGMPVVFTGTISAAYADFQSAPEVGFQISAQTGLLEATAPMPPHSYTGPADVSVVMSGLAVEAGLAFENNGVSVILQKPYFSGSPRNQIFAAAYQANINWVIDSSPNNIGAPSVLAIWPKNGSRKGTAPLLSKETGMVGYPAYTAQGIVVKTIYNPSISFGGQIVVKSDLDPASGTWNVFGIDHDLDANDPGGQWFSTIQATNPNNPTPIAQ